jgi:cytochrome c-type biogenesis protein CcmH/NrfF
MVRINPLVNWIWFGVGILVFGTMIAFLPERAFSFAVRSVPEGAITTSLVLLLMFSAGAVGLRADHVPGVSVPAVPKSALEKDLQEHIVCMCGTCGRQRINDCTCSTAAKMRQELSDLVAQGLTRDQIVQHFVQEWGSQEVLAEPIDKGFNRLAWLLPYGVGVIGIVVAGGVAVRWSRRRTPSSVAARPPTPAEQALEDRLNDELRDLD